MTADIRLDRPDDAAQDMCQHQPRTFLQPRIGGQEKVGDRGFQPVVGPLTRTRGARDRTRA
jgi:hypothetical protein